MTYHYIIQHLDPNNNKNHDCPSEPMTFDQALEWVLARPKGAYVIVPKKAN